MTADLWTLFDEARANPTDLDRALEKHRWPHQKPRLSADGASVRNDLAMERALFRYREQHAGSQVRVEFQPEGQQPLLYRVDGVLEPELAYAMEFVGPNGMRRHEALLIRTPGGTTAIPISIVKNVELL